MILEVLDQEQGNLLWQVDLVVDLLLTMVMLLILLQSHQVGDAQDFGDRTVKSTSMSALQMKQEWL